MQLTLEVVLSWIGGAASGALVAYLGNRVMNAELWGHVKKHCGEIAHVTADTDKALERIENQDRRLVRIEYQHELDQRGGRS